MLADDRPQHDRPPVDVGERTARRLLQHDDHIDRHARSTLTISPTQVLRSS